MAGTRPTVTVDQGPGRQEFQVTLDQAKEISSSCTKAALAGLNPTERSQLRAAIERIKGQVSAAGDALRTRRSKVSAQLQRLQARKDAVDADSDAFSNFYRLMAPAISTCAEAAETAAIAHTAIQPVVRTSVELNYKILLAKTQEGLILQRIELVQAALASLDRAALAVS